MEKTLNMGAFEVLDNREMMEVDGGWGPAIKSLLKGYLESKIIEQGEKIYHTYKDDVRGYNFLCR